MPIVQIKLTKGRTEEKKATIAKKITKIVSDELDVKEEWVTVLFDEYEKENWATCGEFHSKKSSPGKSFFQL